MSNPWDNLKDAPKTSTQTSTPNSFAQTITSQPIPQQPIASQSNVQQPIGNSTSPSEAAFSWPPIAAKPSIDRKSAFFLLAIGAGITIFDWLIRSSQNVYYVKIAVLGPLLAVLGLVGLTFSSSLDKQTDDSAGKIARIAGIVLGIAAGGLNWYLLAN